MSKTSEHRAKYNANTARWRSNYFAKAEREELLKGFSISADLSVVQIVRTCAKSGCKRKPAHRHHKGHEYLFATLDEEKYAERYIRFLPDDVVWLCKKCHMSIHRKYNKFIAAMFNALNAHTNEDKSLWNYIIAGAISLKLDSVKLSECETKRDILEFFRLALVTYCERWLKRGVHNKQKRNTKGRKPSGNLTKVRSARN